MDYNKDDVAPSRGLSWALKTTTWTFVEKASHVKVVAIASRGMWTL